MQEIRDAYMAKADALVASSLKTLEPIQQKFAELNSDVRITSFFFFFFFLIIVKYID